MIFVIFSIFCIFGTILILNKNKYNNYLFFKKIKNMNES